VDCFSSPLLEFLTFFFRYSYTLFFIPPLPLQPPRLIDLLFFSLFSFYYATPYIQHSALFLIFFLIEVFPYPPPTPTHTPPTQHPPPPPPFQHHPPLCTSDRIVAPCKLIAFIPRFVRAPDSTFSVSLQLLFYSPGSFFPGPLLVILRQRAVARQLHEKEF